MSRRELSPAERVELARLKGELAAVAIQLARVRRDLDRRIECARLAGFGPSPEHVRPV